MKTKESLFGMCLGWFVKYTDPLNNENSETGTLTSVFGKDVEIEYEDDGGLVEIQLTSFCQLIARRISSMTEEEKKEYVKARYPEAHTFEFRGNNIEFRPDTNKWSNLHIECLEWFTIEQFEWLIEHRFLPDKYFDNGWAVEARNENHF